MTDSPLHAATREELAMILDGVADGVIALDAAGAMIFVNETAATMLGFASAAEAIGAKTPFIAEGVALLDARMAPIPAADLPFERARRGENPPETLVALRRGAGEPVRWTLIRSGAVRDGSGAVRSVITILRDVTAARLTENALRAANEALRAVFRASPLPIIVLDCDATIRLWNPAAERIFGWKEEELLGAPVPFVPPEFRGEFDHYLDLVVRGNEIPPLETKRLTKKGDLLDVTVWATSFISPEGRRQVIGILADATDARRAAAERERLLRQSETDRNFLRVILEQLPLGARVCDAKGEIILSNRHLESIFRADGDGLWAGYRADGRPLDKIEWPIFRSLRSSEPVVNEEIQISRGDGTAGTVMVSAAPVRDDDGTTVGAAGVIVDITERKRAEMASRFLAEASRLLTSSLDHRERLRTVAQLAVPWLADWCAVHLVRRDGTIGTVTIAHPDPERKRWAEHVAPEYRPNADSSVGVARVIRTGISEMYEEIQDSLLREAAADGATLEMLRGLSIHAAMIVPLVGRQRTLGAITFMSSDPTRRFDATDRALAEELGRRGGLAVENAILFRRESAARVAAERAARRTATLQRFAEALSEAATPDTIADLIVHTGLKHLGADAGSLYLVHGETITRARSAGYRPEAAARWTEFSTAADLPIAEAIRERRIVTYSSLDELFAHYPGMRAIPQWTHRSFAAVPLIVGTRAIGAVGLNFLAERAFESDEIELMLAVARQCAQAVDRARLLDAERSARAEAEAANRAKDEFLATLSHELRTPMTATLGWARMLSLLNVDEETLRLAIDSIFRSTQAQARIVDDLLDVARIVTGKMKIEARPMLLRPLIVEALESVKAAAEARSISIELLLADPPVPVVGDPDRLRQVIWNLLSNAIKFTHPGGHVLVHLDREAEHARLTIRDDGQGIRAEILPLIFERFRQGDSSSSRAAAGLGLGLSIVKHLVELHGGTVAAASDGEGKGATFTITIPIAPRESVDLPSSPPKPERRLLGRSVLVVDDARDTCLMIATTLRQFGAEVRTAASAGEAIAMLRASLPHLVLSDLAMPDVDGFTLAGRIREEIAPQLPLVALTAYGRPEDREKAFAAGFTAYLRKPVDPEVLVESISRLLT
ncbi:MAG TPA: PAS domain S-box protein [Thermoanaerobaculia bacterium]